LAERRAGARAVAAAVCVGALCAGAWAQDRPDVVIPLRAVGYVQESEHVLGAKGYVESSLHYVDATHLLFTYNKRELIKREGENAAGEHPQVVEAVVLELPSGKVVARAEWKLPDHAQFLWPLGKGAFLLRIGAELRVLAPMAGTDMEGRALLTMPARITDVQTSPDGRMALVQAEVETKPYDAATHAPAEHEVEVRFLEFDVERAARGEAGSVQVRGHARVPAMLGIPVNGEGYLTAQEAFPQPDDFDVVYTKMSGEKQVLGDVVSACAPQMAFVSEREFLTVTCNGDASRQEMSVETLGRKELWQGPLDQDLDEAGVRATAASGRFVLVSEWRTSKGSEDNPQTELHERLDVLDVKSGALAATVEAVPGQASAQNFDLNADGRELAVVQGETIGLYRLTPIAEMPAAKIKAKDYIFVGAPEGKTVAVAPAAAAKDAAGAGAVIEAPLNVDARRTKPSLLTPEEQAKREREGKKGPMELPAPEVPKRQTDESPKN